MRYDFLREPISEAEPCGPDLEESLDPDYNNYVQEATGLIPERFYDRTQNKIFDRSKINVAQNETAIAGLLKRTRDIRLLVLDARLQLLGTKLVGFSEALEGLVIVVSGFWDTFHPLPLDGDMILRQNTLEGLDDLRVLIPALHFTAIVEGRSRLTYRNYLVATGKVEPWESEEVINRDAVDRILYDENNRDQLTASHTAATNGVIALETLRSTFIEHAGHLNAPAFDKLAEQLVNMRAFLAEYLGIGEEKADEAESTGAGEAAGAVGPVATHGAAAAALKAAEDYFLRMEPSSPVLILVHQARLLLGRPLIEALETLLTESATRASVRFEAGFRFQLDLPRMKLVTDDLLASVAAASESAAGDSWSSGSSDSWSGSSDSDSWSGSSDSSSDESSSSEGEEASESTESSESGEAESESSEEPAAESTDAEESPAPSLPTAVGTTVALDSAVAYAAATRLEASQLLSAVESFFKQVEPSSPIPTLLIRARSYLGKDFSAILNEMMPPEPAPGSE